MRDPYEVLGIPSSATDDEVKAAYRNLAKKYHEDAYANSPLSDVAQEKMEEINNAYDAIIRQRRQFGNDRQGGGQQGTYTGTTSQYADVRAMLSSGRYPEAETLLDGVPSASRDAEWYFLKSQVLYRKGWLEDAYTHCAKACQMDPYNNEYRYRFSQMEAQRRGRTRPVGGCTACDVCNGLICADCCCECMGGDLISCC